MDHCSPQLDQHVPLGMCGGPISSQTLDNSDQNAEDGTDSGLEDADMSQGPDGLDMMDSSTYDLPACDGNADGKSFFVAGLQKDSLDGSVCSYWIKPSLCYS